MFTTVLALSLLALTSLLVLAQARDIARETVELLMQAADRARSMGILLQRASFLSLWALIFALCFY